MSYPILYRANETNFSTLGLGVLSDATSALITEERNGIFYLEMKYPIDGVRFNEIKNDRLIKADAGNKLKNQRFKINHITKPSKGIVTIYASHVSQHTEELQLKPEVNYSGNALNALNIWKNNLVDAHPFTVFSDIQTQGSGKWSIEEVENARRALGGVRGSILDSYGGEYRFDNYHIGLYAQRGDDSGALIAYGKNLVELEQEEEIASTYTSIYPFSIFINDDGSEELVTLPEYFIDSEYLNNYARRKILRVDFSTEDIRTEEELRLRTQRYIEDNDVGLPKVNLKVKFIDLAKTLDYKDLKIIEEINLCDWVNVHFKKLDITQRAKVIKIVWDVLLDRYEELQIGEARASFSKSIDMTVNGRLEEKIDPVTRRLNIIMTAANGKNKNFYGPDEPTGDLRIGDSWYKPIGDGEFELYIYNGHTWGDPVVTTGINTETNQRLEEAKDIAETAKINTGLVKKEADSILAGLGLEGIGETNQSIVDHIKMTVGDKIGELETVTSNFNSELLAVTGELSDLDSTVGALSLHVDGRVESLQSALDSGLDERPTFTSVNNSINEATGEVTSLITAVTETPEETIPGYSAVVSGVEGNAQEIGKIINTPEQAVGWYNTLVETAEGNTQEIGKIINTPENSLTWYTSLVETAEGLETEISNIKTTPTETIIGYSNLKETAEGNARVIGRIKTTPETEIANYQRITETVDLYERVIGETEEGVKDNVARIVMADNLFQTQVSDLLSETSTTVTQLSSSWVLGIKNSTDLVASINASPSGVRIFGRNIVLDGDTTVVGSFTVTDTIFANNLSISKFTTGTLNAANVNLINVNVNSLVGNTSNFVRSAWNGINSFMTADALGITIQSTNSWDLKLRRNGLEIDDRDGNPTGKFTALVNTVTREPMALGIVAERTYDAIIGYRGTNSPSGTNWFTSIRVNGTSGDISLNKSVRFTGDVLETSVPTIIPNLTASDSFYWNSLTEGGVTIRNSNSNNVGVNFRNDGHLTISGKLVPGTIYDSTGRSSGLQITRGTIGGTVGGYYWRHSNSNGAGIFFADNGNVYIRNTSGTWSLVRPNFG